MRHAVFGDHRPSANTAASNILVTVCAPPSVRRTRLALVPSDAVVQRAVELPEVPAVAFARHYVGWSTQSLPSVRLQHQAGHLAALAIERGAEILVFDSAGFPVAARGGRRRSRSGACAFTEWHKPIDLVPHCRNIYRHEGDPRVIQAAVVSASRRQDLDGPRASRRIAQFEPANAAGAQPHLRFHDIRAGPAEQIEHHHRNPNTRCVDPRPQRIQIRP